MASETGAVQVAAAVIFRESKLLITQRPAQAHLGNLWEFPGGKVEPGEAFETCLQRELREELGIEIAVGELLESLTHSYPDKTVHLQFYRCLWTDNELRALGCQAFRWVSLEELGSFEFPAADARLLALLRAQPEFWRA
jgi:mutator protein MutT